MNLIDALIIDPNATTRGYLWQATIANPLFQRVKAFSKPITALARLEEGMKFDCIILSSALSHAEVDEFIKSAKGTSGGKEAAYVCVLRRDDQSSDSVAQGLIGGSDGFLFEPFSADSLRQVAAIAARVRREFECQRLKAAFKIMLLEVSKALDAFANAKLIGQDEAIAHKNLKKATKSLEKIKPEDLAIYYEVATEVFGAAPPRPAISYKGASNRVKKKVTEQTLKGHSDKH